MNVVDRAKNLIMQPKQEWPAIEAEPMTMQEIYTQYVIILAAIGPIASFIGYSLVGIRGYRVPIGPGIAYMVLSYVLLLGAVYVLALVIDAFAPKFGGVQDFDSALKVAAFSPTAAWLASVFSIVPLLGILGILGLYSVYLLYLGLPMLMRVPEEKSIPYLLVVVIAVLIIGVAVTIVAGLAIPAPLRGF
ncbi:MAG TPA: Yip1 family protein [Usitatibacter sp.]|nr:Yip1 family protein [Usitatibacter sp.]